jgi:DNA-binding Lrp family transcriptional regulator
MEVKDHKYTMEAFETRVTALDEVTECRRMFGDSDYLMWIAVADHTAYEHLYVNELVGLPGVTRTTSQLTMHTVKSGGRVLSQDPEPTGRYARRAPPLCSRRSSDPLPYCLPCGRGRGVGSM